MSIGILLLVYVQKINEVKYSQKLGKKIKNIFKNIKLSEKELKKINAKTMAITEIFKLNKNVYSNFEKYIQQISKFEAKIISIEEKKEKNKQKLFNKVQKLKRAKKQNSILFKQAVVKFNEYNLENEKSKILAEKENYIKDNVQVISTFEKAKKQNNLKIQDLLNILLAKKSILELANYSKLYLNALNSVEIEYGFEDKIVYKFPKEFKLKLKNKEV